MRAWVDSNGFGERHEVEHIVVKANDLSIDVTVLLTLNTTQ
jgi:hypothetical protein